MTLAGIKGLDARRRGSPAQADGRLLNYVTLTSLPGRSHRIDRPSAVGGRLLPSRNRYYDWCNAVYSRRLPFYGLLGAYGSYAPRLGDRWLRGGGLSSGACRSGNTCAHWRWSPLGGSLPAAAARAEMDSRLPALKPPRRRPTRWPGSGSSSPPAARRRCKRLAGRRKGAQVPPQRCCSSPASRPPIGSANSVECRPESSRSHGRRPAPAEQRCLSPTSSLGGTAVSTPPGAPVQPGPIGDGCEHSPAPSGRGAPW